MPVLVPTAGQQLAVNGVDLSQYGVILQSKAPLMSSPPRRGENVTVPGRHGTIRTPRKRYEENDLVLVMLVLGAQPDGTVPSDSTAAEQLYANADALMGLFGAETVLLTRTMPDGSQRNATAEVVEKIDWSRQLGDTPLLAQVGIALTIFDAFWADTSPVSQTITGATGTTATLTAFQGATAPISDVTITWGPCSNPQLIHGPAFVTYNGVISAGRQLVINTANWTVSTGSGTAWSPDLRLVSFGPGPAWMELNPWLNPFAVQIVHTGGGSASCTLTAARRYLSA